MRHIDHRRRIVDDQLQNLSFFHAAQALGCFEDGQGAEKPHGIKGLIVLH